jgi:membrane protease subunit HflC
MKNVSVVIFIGLIAAILVLFLVTFQVRETENAVVTTFGNPTRSIEEPGFYWKWPSPIQTVNKFDSRVNLFQRVMAETTTRGGETIIVTTYVTWRIEQPQKFLENVSDKEQAQDKLNSLLGDTQSSVIGQYYFSQFVNSDPSKIMLSKIEEEIAQHITAIALKQYGIGIEAVGIKQIGVPEAITPVVFDRMRADRARKAESIMAQGKAEAARIRKDAESKGTELLAVVEAEAKAIRGKGDAEAAKYYKMLEADPELAMFLRDVEALKVILKDKSTIILGADSDPIKLLKGMPELQQK